ncbi:MAG: methyltransferase domain-containing protein [Chloroflexota bacterium]|nr:methyltransferase domain-containing protein [Chloroflexota bacterium]
MSKTKLRPNICDYEGSNYRTEFWEGKGRDYEDQVERGVLRRWLPAQGRRLLEVGAGFGRLTDEYHGYQQVVLLDYSLSQLQYAQEHHGRDSRFVYVAADAYHLPFKAGVFDGATMIRVIHHMADVSAILAQMQRVLTQDGLFILEHANKRHLKAIARYALKQQKWDPNTLDPVEFVELNFDFHPDYIVNALQAAEFVIEERLPVSYLRVNLLKERVPVKWLVAVDELLQRSRLLFSPSIFTRCRMVGSRPNHLEVSSIFACPECGGDLIHERVGDEETLYCPKEGLRWAIRDGIYDFKAVLE